VPDLERLHTVASIIAIAASTGVAIPALTRLLEQASSLNGLRFGASIDWSSLTCSLPIDDSDDALMRALTGVLTQASCEELTAFRNAFRNPPGIVEVTERALADEVSAAAWVYVGVPVGDLPSLLASTDCPNAVGSALLDMAQAIGLERITHLGVRVAPTGICWGLQTHRVADAEHLARQIGQVARGAVRWNVSERQRRWFTRSVLTFASDVGATTAQLFIDAQGEPEPLLFRLHGVDEAIVAQLVSQFGVEAGFRRLTSLVALAPSMSRFAFLDMSLSSSEPPGIAFTHDVALPLPR
jgi:hypothetical protein